MRVSTSLTNLDLRYNASVTSSSHLILSPSSFFLSHLPLYTTSMRCSCVCLFSLKSIHLSLHVLFDDSPSLHRRCRHCRCAIYDPLYWSSVYCLYIFFVVG